MGRAGTYHALAAGIVSISFAAIFIKLADADPIVVAALRMMFAAALLLPAALFSSSFRSEVSVLGGGDIGLLVCAGSLLALHFLFWITSLSYTGITSSIVFVTASPLFVAVYTVLVFREKVHRSFWAGLLIALAGAAIMAGNNLFIGGGNWRGDLLAILGAISAAGYFLSGSRLRKRLSLLTYVFPVYSVAALILLLLALLTGKHFTGLPGKSYLYCFLMAVVCQVSGHSLFNWALRRMKATSVTIGVLGEPAGTTILAFLILHEVPLVSELIGGVFFLAGIFVVLYFNPGVIEEAGELNLFNRE